MAKTVFTRIQHKHDIEANWLKATNFVPLQGELIVYDDYYIDNDGNKVVVADFVRFKVGDGITVLNDLPFTDEVFSTKIEDLKAELSVQPDWSQNDPSATGYIQNRTHWLDKSTNLILEEITVEANSWGGAELSEGILSPIVGDGRLYSITLDGVTYDCNSWMISYGEPRIGDSRLLEADSEKEEHPEDVPFLIDYYEEDLSGDSWLPDDAAVRISSYITFATPGTHTIKIEEVLSYECHPLDEVFIPDTIARTSEVTAAVKAVKDDLLNGAGAAYDTLKELGDLIDDNTDAIDALETVATGKADAAHKHNYYGVCSTPAATAAKTVEIEGFELVEGAIVIVKFTNANSKSDPTLNVSGTGALPMYRYGTTKIATSGTTSGWLAGAVQMFVYDGTGWIREYWNNNTYAGYSLGFGCGTCDTAADTVDKVVTCASYSLGTGGIVSIKFSNDVCANATLNINGRGAKPLCYRDTAIVAGIIKAGDTATVIYDGANYDLLAIDRWHEDIKEIQASLSETTTAVAAKKDKDLVVTYRNGSHYYVTHDCSELYAAFQNGQTIYFQKDLELLNLLEINNDYATFYMYYVTQEGKPRQQVVAIANDSIIMELDDEYNYATADDLNKYALKTDIPTITTPTAITDAEIDEICGGSIQYAEDVMF